MTALLLAVWLGALLALLGILVFLWVADSGVDEP